MNLKDLVIFVQLCALLCRPHGYRSLNGVARRLRLPNDDALRRCISRLESSLSVKLIENGERLAITELGRHVYRYAEQLLNVGTAAHKDGLERLLVEVDELAADFILILAMGPFLEAWLGQLLLTFCPFQPGKTRSNIASGITSFGIGVGEGGEPVQPGFDWRIIGAKEFTVTEAEQVGSVLGGQLLFLPPAEQQPHGIDDWLRQVPASHRVECSSCRMICRLVTQGHGLGLIPALALATNEEGLHWLPVPELTPLQLSIFLPRGDLGDPARLLASLFRESIQRLSLALSSNGSQQIVPVETESTQLNDPAEPLDSDELSESELLQPQPELKGVGNHGEKK